MSAPGPQPLGDGALRFPLPGEVDARALLAALRALPGVVDAIVGEHHAAVYFDPAQPPEGEAVSGVILDAVGAAGARGAASAAEVVIGVRYDGPDLAAVAQATGLSPAEVIALHLGRSYEVRLVGFLPGFAYLREVDPRIAVPRRAAPRPRVPAGAVAIAGPYTGIYPLASAGGWNLIGTAVDFTLFSAAEGARLAPGDRVRFVRVDP